jgi:hypothetical protein
VTIVLARVALRLAGELGGLVALVLAGDTGFVAAACLEVLLVQAILRLIAGLKIALTFGEAIVLALEDPDPDAIEAVAHHLAVGESQCRDHQGEQEQRSRDHT